MKITLIINNEEKIFEAPFISARKLRETLALSDKVNKEGMNIEIIDDLTKFIVGVYGNQFTEDDLLDGLASDKLFEKALSDMKQVINGFDESIKN